MTKQQSQQPTKEQMFDSLVKFASTQSDYHLVQFFNALDPRSNFGMFCQMSMVAGKSTEEAIVLTLQHIHEKAQKLS